MALENMSMTKEKQNSDSYAERVNQQIKQFHDPEKLKKLPPIYHYYMQKFVRPKIQEVFGVDNSMQIYVNEFREGLANTQSNRILSIGSGDGNIEIAIALNLVNSGITNFTIDCLELSPVRTERAIINAKKQGVLDKLNFVTIDLNSWKPTCVYAGVMAHHVLHHIVNLESLFDSILAAMDEGSVFVSIDMIGRNGHMRWPECEAIIHELWKMLPDKYKYNHQFKKQHDDFINWNCAHKGFEGIRAQDILPLLNKYFQYDRFLGYGNLIDVFIERGYGHNFDVENKTDLQFIDAIGYLNEFLLSTGYLKPTIMFAVWKKHNHKAAKKICYSSLDPLFSIRETDFSKKLSV